MKLQEFISFVKANPLCYLASCDGKQPNVRALLLYFAGESGFYFGTLAPKEMSKQLHKNPKVELCFYNNPKDITQAKQLQRMGEVEFVHDKDLIHKLHEE